MHEAFLKHFEIGKCMNGLAPIAAEMGRYAESESRFRELVVFFDEVLGPKHHFTWMVRGNLAYQIAAQGRLADRERARRDLEEAFELGSLLFPPSDPRVVQARRELSSLAGRSAPS